MWYTETNTLKEPTVYTFWTLSRQRDIKFLQNDDTGLQDFTASQLRKPQYEPLPS
jgi:hypothetical protein